MDAKTVLEQLFDEDNTDNVVLYDENDNEVEFEQIAVIPYEERLFCILKPVGEVEGIEDDEGVVFEIFEEDDENGGGLCTVDESDIIDAVFGIYYDMLDE